MRCLAFRKRLIERIRKGDHMKKIVKKILCLVLAVSCSITMLPSIAFAEFTTSSGTTSGSGKKYNKLVNLVNVGYRISLYYEGKDETSGKQYFPSIAFNETSDKPLMRRFATDFSPENYVASKNMEGKISATYFRDKAAQKASILVLNNTGNSFGTIYQLKPTFNYKSSTMTWDDVDESRICKKNSDNKVYKLLNEYTDGGLKRFQEKSWLGTKQGASAIVNTEDLDKIDKI